MQPNLLKSFYNDEHTRDAVRDFLMYMLNEEAIRRVMERKDTSSLADAKDVIDSAFTKLREEFGQQPKTFISNSR